MRIATTIAEARQCVRALRQQGQSIGLVPTMGALHAGHISLVEAARAAGDTVVASIFVNPTQFGPGEDFTRYPRTFEADCDLLREQGTALLFSPSREEMYPAGFSTFVSTGQLGDRLDGASRPGHFNGVATIVSRLFHILTPERAYFGQKDAAQVAVLQRMVRDLDFEVSLVVCPTIRDRDGLALSSRNRYLSSAERARALSLSRALGHIAERCAGGITDAETLIREGLAILAPEGPSSAGEASLALDYLCIVDPATLVELADTGSGALAAVAVSIGGTRLIDNVLLPASASIKTR